MSAVSRVAFFRYLRTLDPDAFERFVADLWRARGWMVERDGETLVVDHPTLDDSRRLTVRAVPWWSPWSPPISSVDADLTVVNRPAPRASASIVDATDLYRMIRYAIDEESRTDLLDPVLGQRGSLTALAIRRLPPVTTLGVAAVIVGAAVLLAAAVGVTVHLTGELVPAAVEGDDVSPRPGTETGADESTDSAPSSELDATDVYPPGLSTGGVTDPSALATAHAERVVDRPRVITLRVEKYEDSRLWGTYEERVVVLDDDDYVSEIDVRGNPRGFPPVTTATEVFADGDSVDVNVEPALTTDRRAARQAAPRDASEFTRRIEPYLERALSVNGTDVVATRRRQNRTVYHVEGSVHQGLGGQDQAVSARVTASGTVLALQHEYDLPVADGSITVTIEYEFGQAKVDRPAWVDVARETD